VITRAAERYYFGGDAIGKPLYFDAGVPTTVVGVIDDIKDQSLVRREQRRAYAPYAQQLADLDEPELYLELRTLVDPAAVAAAVRNVIAATDPELIIAEMAPLSTLMGNSIRQQRLLTFVALAFGCVSLALAIIGLYGAMSYAVGTRRREMGLRGALGAEPIRLVRLVLADGLRLVVIGLLLGAPLALVAARLLRAQLTDVPPTDPLSLIGASMILICSAAVAALIPARRAAHVSPLVALRGD
jgi:predicted lysophospholipase L1 biosynthesis ABC-type transport system permease subunit